MGPWTQENIQSLIDDNTLFKNLNPQERLAVGDIASLTSYQPDEVILTEGQSVPGLGLIVEGAVKVSTAIAHDEDMELKILTTGAWFGEVGFITGKAATATVTGLEAGRYILWPTAALHRILEDQPMVHAMLKNMVLRRAEDTIAKTLRRKMGGV